eukprot:TRINITY_DN4905_c0_g1_i1.p1 TRINITY_DN4905_c0_g1~~TRINITY_DN4905_c0_g1_i1.p1  ORF type:complete len:779 (-),score=177.13 TRINITY_DN4905_c0_g1_i1:142-2478(-)
MSTPSTAATAPIKSAQSAMAKAPPQKNFLKEWQTLGPLTSDQQQSFEALGWHFSERSIPIHVKHVEESKPKAAVSQSSDATLHECRNVQQFYTWFESIEEQMAVLDEQKYRMFAADIDEYKNACESIIQDIDQALQQLNLLQTQQAEVAQKTGALHNECQALVQEQDRLLNLADSIQKKLGYFEEYTKLSSELPSQPSNIQSKEFLPVLYKIDDCIDYLSRNLQYRDAEAYLAKYRQLQVRALSMVRNHTITTLRNTSHFIANQTKDASSAGHTEASLFYVRFRSISMQLKQYLVEIEKRSGRQEIAQLLGEVQECYFSQRHYLLHATIVSNVEAIARSGDLHNLIRAGCTYLLRVCQLEFQLYHAFFEKPSDELSNFLESISNVLYETIRPAVIQQTSIDSLGELVEILNVEVLEEIINRKGESASPFKPVVEHILQDIQERLIYRTFVFIREDLQSFNPAPEELDYPARLQSPGPDSASQSSVNSPAGLYKSWYPTLERTLMCLSKLYRSVDKKTFEGLANECVFACMTSLVSASKQISRNKSAADGSLFLIRHLILLRDQIAPFEVSFSVKETTLDFTQVKDTFFKIFREGRSLFSLGPDNGIMAIVQQSIPKVLESRLDAKKELEKEIKASCDATITSIVRLAIDPLVSFLAKVSAFLTVRDKKSVGNREALGAQSFAHPDRIREMVHSIDNSLANILEPHVSRILVYLVPASAESALLRPIRAQISDAVDNLQNHLRNEYDAEQVADLLAWDSQAMELKLMAVMSRSDTSLAT